MSDTKFKMPTGAGMMCPIDEETSFCLKRTHRLEIWVPHIISPTMTKAFMT